ncbi:hypothetical protein Y032_0004g1731 [Ancylostoma ceylanicum]|uniref:Uncharacterized protein n=1 Tax=Ancylostoma ceylanicum TaxID=53326 RepID=A0A016VT07_9BILA|nr:hypothetical protein Y032_0004g1731 [Ancylostoma ceylanicum]
MPSINPHCSRGGFTHVRGGQPTPHLGQTSDPPRAETQIRTCEAVNQNLGRSESGLAACITQHLLIRFSGGMCFSSKRALYVSNGPFAKRSRD